MAHEMSHVVLEHEFKLLLATDSGCRASSSSIEGEAAELSGELLIPWEATKQAAFRGLTDQEVATCFNVSEPMARWRMNASGARKIATRAGGRKPRPF
jgi:Zn-dependent peptidase ImmA (M78 family)